MKLYVFGNPDHNEDKSALSLAHKLKDIDNLHIIFIEPNQDLPFTGENHVYILDVIQGIDKITFITEKDIDSILLSPRNTVHDFDLGFQLKYLKKLGKLKKITIIGLPYGKEADQALFHSILRKLVAQDIQGS